MTVLKAVAVRRVGSTPIIPTNILIMIPYGKNRKMRYNYPDNHPQKGWVNWWEVEMGGVSKGRARQEGKREIKNQLNEN